MTSSPASARKRYVSCPTCGGRSLYAPDNPYRPFCSQRCKLQDLGAWASESFRLDAGDGEAGAPSAGEDRPRGQ